MTPKKSFDAGEELSSLEFQITEQLDRLEMLQRARHQLSADVVPKMVPAFNEYYEGVLKPQIIREREQLLALITQPGEMVTQLRSGDVTDAESAAATSSPSS
ncbi:MAG TPA: hypothetical protein PLW65_18010 [Pseudomonadota bacterium]|nr:hypothetical protein [Pseudomonadota bacterium]